MNVSLPDLMKDWVEEQIKTGHYSNASDYVRDLIRRDLEYQDKREILIKALISGEASGVSERTVADIWQDVKKRHRLDV
jgi:antitoxin ParD1/3/4